MASTEVQMSEAEKQHLGMVEVRLDSQQALMHTSPGDQALNGYTQGHGVQSGAPPSYAQSTNHIPIQPPQPQTAPRSTKAFSGAPRPDIPDYSRLALMVTFCCCLPFGLIAYFMNSRAQDKQLFGDDDGARSSSRCALGFAIAGILCGCILSALIGIYYFVLIGV
ncbi:uncharacterized protein LOC121428195 isoform X2 [Lytechinus variegatus]|uniref:uncharacterized protein LOC121428195 isoform X2 n=1 Tax=Lytechinus variegatus TaxID=7654 RepID=UPI001BB14CF4|nr:uncharacterized protein LOC121428195 isoform X2 [Lytechinus variegatus]